MNKQTHKSTHCHPFALEGYTGCSNAILTFLISNFDIILSKWEFNQFLYMLLGVLTLEPKCHWDGMKNE